MAKRIETRDGRKFRRRPKIKLPPIDPDTGEPKLYDFSKITPKKKSRLKQFVSEYIKDFCGRAAMQRMGIESKGRDARATEWLREPYAQHLLDKLLRTMDEKAIVSRNTVLAGLLRESNYKGIDGHASSRVAALRALAKILGMEITKIEGSMNVNGGVMAIPCFGSLDDWEKIASQKQSELKQEVRQ
jgi:hypothetical protein